VPGLCELERLKRVDESRAETVVTLGLPAQAAGALTVRMLRIFAGVSVGLCRSSSATMPLMAATKMPVVSW
jgi:hypothetical protein